MKNISIIIPYYKKKKYIKKTLDSINKQTYKNFEVLIVYDDECTKDLIYLKSLIKNKKNYRIFKNNFNMGAGYSRNIGIQKAKGKFIAFLDADDYWHKDKLYYQINMMLKKNYLITHTDYQIFNRNISLEKKKIRIAKTIDFNSLLFSCDIGLSTVMLKKSALKRCQFPNLTTKEDFAFWLSFLKKNKCKIYPVNKILLYWRNSPNSLSSHFHQKIKDSYLLYKKYCKFNYFKSILFVIILSFNALIKKIYD